MGLWEKTCSPDTLRLAWARVRDNRGGPGVDGITVEQFERNLEENLSLLRSQLVEGNYTPLPVLRAYVDRGDGAKRPIGIPTVRDRVVQESLLLTLSPVFETEFLDCNFGYRPGRSALDAVSRVEALVKDGCKWVLDADIRSFFDTIDQELLLQFVEEKVPEPPISSLLSGFLRAGVFEDMSLREEYLGIPQGSVISPLLANIYLHRFDRKLLEEAYHLVRYADDFVILEASQERAGEALVDVARILKTLRLSLNEDKTRLIHAREGFVFLGYYIDVKGKGPCRKAIDVITRRLQEISSQQDIDAETKVEQLKQATRGWSSYFHTCRGIEPSDAFILLALVEISLELGDEENAKRLFGKRSIFPGEDARGHFRLGELARTMGLRDDALDEFSRALAIDPGHHQAREALKRLELIDEDTYASIERLRRLIYLCPELAQPYRDLASCYAEVGEYGLAKETYEKALRLESPVQPSEAIPAFLPEPYPVTPSEEELSLFLSLFRGREGVFARQWVDEKGRRGFYPSTHALSPEDLKRHFEGEETLGIYLIGEEDKVHLSVLDIDVNQKALLEYAKDREKLSELQNLAHGDATKIASLCDNLKIEVLVEDSGYKGRHLWFFFAEPLPAKLARKFLKFISDKAGSPPGGVHREIFPTSDKAKGYGSLIKLPLGIHNRTGRRCLFLDRRGNPLPDQLEALRQIKPIPQKEIEDILLTFSPPRIPQPVEEVPPLVRKLLSGCRVINHLVDKARKTHYLDNSERVTLLYTLGHLGEEGKSFLHKVMSYCLNYDYGITEKHIRKLKEHPISCAKIKEKHETIVLELGCDCSFTIPPRGYPSPILHVFKDREFPAAREKHPPKAEPDPVSDDINTRLKKLIELKSHFRGIERSIRRVEEEMSSYFDRLGKESVDTEYGLLSRRKTADGWEWTIKL
jgi:group II intron reverse transcriptase/maturase